jgi:uncharacterized membrane protein YccC
MNAWLQALELATNGEEILEDARDYCCLVSPRDLAILPEDCRRIRLDEAGDIPACARKLSASVGALHERSAEALRLHELVRFLSRAEQRLGELSNGSGSRAASSRTPESVDRCIEA